LGAAAGDNRNSYRWSVASASPYSRHQEILAMRRLLLPTLLLAALAAPAALYSDDKKDDTKTAVPEGFTPLFNGKDLMGWTVLNGKKDLWGVDKDKGILFVNGGGGGWLMTEKEYSDFEIRVDFKIPEKGNSGVALRAPLEGDPAYKGMEIQILDDKWHKANLKGLKPVQLTGSIYGVVPPSKDATKPVGEWNTIHITSKGPKVLVELNGTTIVDANLEDHKDQAKEHPGLLRTKGHLGLQSHSERVEFRNVYVKEL
jgi:hypothetical protein